MITLDELSQYIAEDNHDATVIYKELVSCYQNAVDYCVEEVDLLGVYFFDILKFLTHTHFKIKEINKGIQPKDSFVKCRLESWPYLGYDDLMAKTPIPKKKYGKNISVSQSFARKAMNGIAGLYGKLAHSGSPRLDVLTPMIDSKCNLWLSSHFNTGLVQLEENWFAVPSFEEQLNGVLQSIRHVMNSSNHTLDVEIATSLMESHIRANCREGHSRVKFSGDALLLKSGVELQNRMLASVAKKQGKPVINIMHGEAFGVYDEPIFSSFGEQMYSSAILGYGTGVKEVGSYEYGMKESVAYFESNGVQVSRLYKQEYKGIQSRKRQPAFYYYPTTLSGSSHRYGPFRDTADYYYIEWQKILIDLFDNSLKVKSHPKEKYQTICLFPNAEVVSGTFDELLSEIDVFVFDYIGTAFNVACATEKPIVYFDLGIRKIHPIALEDIKERTIYFDIRDGLPSYDEILEKLKFRSTENRYSPKYSLSREDNNRVRALEQGVVGLLS